MPFRWDSRTEEMRVARAQQGHLNDLMTVRVMRDFRLNEASTLKRGDRFSVKAFVPGDRVQVVGTSKGRGFQGVVKRHGFKGGPKTHGHKDNLRMPGSIGAGGVQRVFKDMRMAGHMGDARVTVKNLEIIEIRTDDQELYIKGAVPGARGGLLLISTQEGTLTLDEVVAAEPQATAAEPAPQTQPEPVQA